jgi:hypothetical protein
MNRFVSVTIALLAGLAVVLSLNLAGFARSDLSAMSASRELEGFANRADIRPLPRPLKARLLQLARRPHTYLPLTVFSEAPRPSRLFSYYLLDTLHFQPNIFTTIIPGINDGVAPTATGANHGLPTLATVRLLVEPKPGLPTDPDDPGTFIDIFTDISGLFVINNESGWYEGWMIHDLVVPAVATPRTDGTGAQFGTLTAEDAAALAAIGAGNNVPGHLFTLDGNAPRFPGASDHFPDQQANVVPVQLSMGAYNSLQQSDSHSYWEFNQYTDWVFPHYELPFTGGFANEFAEGNLALLSSVVPGSGPSGTGPSGPGPTGGTNDPRVVGDNPDNPRDPDRLLDLEEKDETNGEHKEKRLRFVPSGLAAEILRDTYMRLASFEPAVTDPRQRLFDAYAMEVARIDENGDGILDAEEADLEEDSDGGQSNERLFIPATQFGRFAVTREINDGLLAPRFAPSQRAWVLSGSQALVQPAVAASVEHDADNR